MVSNSTAATASAPSSSGFRWLQLVMGIVCMAMIANLQYGWTLFVDPIDAKYHWGRAAIQLAFTIFVVTETWLVPVEAWFVDKYGPSVVVMFGGVMIALAWILNSYAELAGAALCGSRRRRPWRRRGVRHLRRQRAEMVSGPPRPCRGRDRRRLRRGCCDHCCADREHDRGQRLSKRVPVFRHRARRDRFPPRLLHSSAVGGDARQEETAQSAANQDRFHAAAGAAQPDLLGDVPGVRDGRGRRPDDGSPDRADRA